MAASDLLSSEPATEKAADGSRVALEDGARVAVIGGGPAGSFFSYQTFLRRIHEDPSIAYKLVQNLCSRVRQLSDALAKLTPGTR